MQFASQSFTGKDKRGKICLLKIYNILRRYHFYLKFDKQRNML